ncbi:TetR/AcrR family transcriptional regulator [Crossiella cryophila]|uniref:AcrR family transcriptional regulator n=1 Tax=Crossiella cryophila TaxID=43355 RepID=A0A7W7C974_9PSEU|nr:TetR/AcrR family transcriptional regulator [Crossiella cryophila]MBB4676757.1 AcrR family transcriptional regulator [Crossiella cryophila]
MPRLSRAESQARTRELLIDTARELFLRDGYHATSLEKVAEAAGFSKGAVYSNFRNKDELCLAVLDALHLAEATQIVAAFQSSADSEQRLAAFDAWAQRMLGDTGWTLLEVEFAVQARRDPELGGQLARRARGLHRAIAALIEQQSAELGLRPALSAEVLAPALLSLGIGLGMQRALDPTLPASVLTDTIRALLQRD